MVNLNITVPANVSWPTPGNTLQDGFDYGKTVYELSNHLGNVLATITDQKDAVQNGSTGVVGYYKAISMTQTDYYPFGMQMVGRTYNIIGAYKFGFNGQEIENDVIIGSYTAKYWHYDSRIGRRWNVDPKNIIYVSPYATFNNNPIWYVDPLGDSSIIDDKGYVLHYNSKDKDLRVFMKSGGTLKLVGELGKTIDATTWFANLLEANSKRADDIWNPLTFRNFVKANGRWDFKSLNQSNRRVETGELKEHILGLAFFRKDNETNEDADLKDTWFKFDGIRGRAEDLNNFHYGVVGLATGLFGHKFLLEQAGEAEMGKAESSGKKVPAEWRPVIGIKVVRGQDGKGEIDDTLGPPYGDNPVDHLWIKRGLKYYERNRKNLDGDSF